MSKKDKNSIIRLIVAALLTGLSLLAVLWAKVNPDAVTGAYGVMSRKISGALAAVFSIFPFSFMEFAIIALIVGVVATLLLLIFRWWRKSGYHAGLRWLSYIVVIVATGFSFFIFSWGLNYYARPLAETIGLQVDSPTRHDLYDAADYYLAMVNDMAYSVERNEDGTCDLGSFSELSRQCPDAYEELASQYSRFRGGYSKPKAITNWRLMSYTQITGIYCPLTGECNVNPDSAPASLPFTMLHEMAHRLGVCPENEANFTALLACRSSGIEEFVYSGYYSAFIYLYNAVAKVDGEKQSELWNGMTDVVLADVLSAIEHYNRYQGKISEAADKVNDTYLKAMNQQSGVESYGEVAELIIADYLQNIK